MPYNGLVESAVHVPHFGAPAGYVSMTCNFVAQIPSVPLAVYLAPSLIGAVLLCIALPLAFIYWRRLASDVANYKQMWHKRRYHVSLGLCQSHDYNA